MKTPATAATPAVRHPQLSALPWQGDRAQCPRWVGYPTRESLPAGLIWSGAGEVPAIGSRVTIYMNGYGPATVNGYFHADGFLGVLCSPDALPDWFKRQSPGVTKGHFFGRDLESRRQRDALASDLPEGAEQARRFWFSLGPNAGGAGTRSEMMSPSQLQIALTREPLERCRKRESSHLLMIWEHYEGTNREAECLAQFWVGSFPAIKLTDWAKEYSKFAF